MTTAEILELDPQELSKMDEREVAKLTATLSSTARKRIKRGIQYNQTITDDSAKIKLPSDKGLRVYSIRSQYDDKEKYKKELLKQFRELKRFLQYKTTTIRGLKQHKKFIENRLEGISRSQYDEIMSIYRKTLEEQGYAERFRYQIYEYLKEEVVSGKQLDDSYIQKIIEKVYGWYEEYEPDEDSDIFEY